MATIYTHIAANKWKTAILLSLFLVFVTGVALVFGYAIGGSDSGPSAGIIAFLISIIWAFISYFASDKITLAMSGAKEVTAKEYPRLVHEVEECAITSGLPVPKVYVINDSAPNAFATGRDPKHASIVVTTGLLDKLNKVELEGVIAHEMSHIGNYDIRLMTVVVVLVGTVALLSDWFLRWSWFGGRRRDDRENDQVGAILAAVAIVLAILSPIIAQLIQLAISRKREYLADASAALLTRYPEGLANALRKISADKEPLEVANKATAHLFIANPLKNTKSGVGWFANLFNTHPPIEDRIRRLEEMAS
jgi:heat shock protein HtpX